MSSLLLLIIVQNGKQAQYHFCDQCHSLGRGFLGPVPTLNFTSAEPNTYLGRPKLLSSTVDSDGRTLHVPNLIRGGRKYHPYCLEYGNKLKKVKFTKPENSCFDFRH